MLSTPEEKKRFVKLIEKFEAYLDKLHPEETQKILVNKDKIPKAANAVIEKVFFFGHKSIGSWRWKLHLNGVFGTPAGYIEEKYWPYTRIIEWDENGVKLMSRNMQHRGIAANSEKINEQIKLRNEKLLEANWLLAKEGAQVFVDTYPLKEGTQNEFVIGTSEDGQEVCTVEIYDIRVINLSREKIGLEPIEEGEQYPEWFRKMPCSRHICEQSAE
jgi:hypothetical protein